MVYRDWLISLPSAYLQKLPICHFDRREKSYSMIIKISQSLRSFEMTRLILKLSTSTLAYMVCTISANAGLPPASFSGAGVERL